MILCLSGKAGVGKNAVADILVKEYGFASIAFADPIKRVVQEIYKFSDESLWGDSELRSLPDKRYPREHIFTGTNMSNGPCCICGARETPDVIFKNAKCYLNPRYALTTFGTEAGRHCYNNTWIDRTMIDAGKILNKSNYKYNIGIHGEANYKHVVITDARFENELEAVRKEGGSIVRIKRAGTKEFSHSSETEQDEVPDDYFSHVIENFGSLGNLEVSVTEMIKPLL